MAIQVTVAPLSHWHRASACSLLTAKLPTGPESAFQWLGPGLPVPVRGAAAFNFKPERPL